jgi:hypothetical protein
VFFSNLYFSTRFGPGTYGNSGESIGFEVTNDRAFKPGGSAGYSNDVGGGTGGLIQWATTNVNNVGIIEAAFSLSIFTSNALGLSEYSTPVSPVGIRLNLSQSFGYSVAGGQTDYGDERLGFVALPQTAIPEPSTYALMGAGLLGLFAAHRRRNRAA